jgi:GT2 family glycosyltransferase
VTYEVEERPGPPGNSPASERPSHRPVLGEITVVIPTLGRPVLERSLAALAGGSAWPACVIVVDQGRSREVGRWLVDLEASGLPTLHLESTAQGRAAGVNLGIRAAATTFVAITDDDCLVEAGWLEGLYRHLAAHPERIVTGRVEGDGVAVVSTSRKPRVQYRPRLQFDGLSGGNMAVAVEVATRLGLLDEDTCLRTAEDGEFAYRALRAGVPIAFVPDAGVLHLDWRAPAERAAQYASYARSHGGFYGKYLRRGDGFIAARAVVHHLRALKRWLRGAVRRDPDLAANGRAYTTGLMPGIFAGWQSASGSRRRPRS